MSSVNLIRWGGLAAVLAGLMYIAHAAGDLLVPGPLDGDVFGDYVLEMLWGGAFALLLLTLVSLRAVHGTRYKRLGTLGFFVAFVGYSVMFAKSFAIVATAIVFDFQAVQEAKWVWGMLFLGSGLLSVSGTVLLGVATFRARVLPPWLGVALVLLWPVTIPLAENGPFAVGLIWALLGYALWARTMEREPVVSA